MTSPCKDILRKAGLKIEEQDLIETMSRQGENTREIREKFFKALDDVDFDDKQKIIREQRTKGYLDLLEDIVLKGKKPYNRLFDLLVGDTSGITSKTLARVQERFGYMASLTKLSNHDIKALLDQDHFVNALLREMHEWSPKMKTGNKLAHDIAGKLVDRQRIQVGEMNSFGAGMRWLDDFITKQWHDPFRMLAGGETKWVNI